MNDFYHENLAAMKRDKRHVAPILRLLPFHKQLIPTALKAQHTHTYQANEFKHIHSSLPTKPSVDPAERGQEPRKAVQHQRLAKRRRQQGKCYQATNTTRVRSNGCLSRQNRCHWCILTIVTLQATERFPF